MATEMSSKLSVRDGLIQVVSAERFQAKPRSGTNSHVVVMEKTGNTLRHYCTLRSDQDKLSIGEQLWGNFVCYVIDLSSRKISIGQEFATQDRITNVRVAADVAYHVVDGEHVAIGVEDALQSLRDELVTVLKREIARLKLEQVNEEHLEGRLYQESARLQGWLGIAIERARVQIDWDKEILARLRADREQRLAQEADDAQRQREWQIDDQTRRRHQRLKMEDITHIDQVIQQLGLDGLPADVRLRLHSLPYEEALKEIIQTIEEQRKFTRDIMGRRMEEEYALLRKLIDSGVLEEMDLVEFGRSLLERYQHSLAMEETFGIPPALLFGDAQRPKAIEGKPDQPESPGQPAPGSTEATPGTSDQNQPDQD